MEKCSGNEHIFEAAGKYRVKIRDGQVVEIGESRMNGPHPVGKFSDDPYNK